MELLLEDERKHSLIQYQSISHITATCRFGGDLNVQSSFYTLAFMIVFSAMMGITNVKQTRIHRKWMLRKSQLVLEPWLFLMKFPQAQ